MNCNELNQHMGDAIDGVLPEHIRQPFQQHLRVCAVCRTSYAFELLGKQVIRHKLQRATTPAQIREEIVQTLRRRAERRRMLEEFFPLPALAGAAVVLAVAIVLTQPRWFFGRPSPPTDIITQSLQNFALVQSGQLKPEKVSCTPEALSAYFEENGVSFVVNIMPVENCDWYGALLSDHQGARLAHVVYKMGDHMLYMFQVRKEDVKEDGVLDLPESARKSLAETGWWIPPDQQQQSVVVWTVDGTLCTAVSSMKKERLLALLTSP